MMAGVASMFVATACTEGRSERTATTRAALDAPHRRQIRVHVRAVRGHAGVALARRRLEAALPGPRLGLGLGGEPAEPRARRRERLAVAAHPAVVPVRHGRGRRGGAEP